MSPAPARTIIGAQIRLDGGARIVLPKTSWGSDAKGFNVEDGHRIEFRATLSTGVTATSGAYTWT